MKRRTILSSLILIVFAPLLCGFLFSGSPGKIKSDTAGVTLTLEGPWWSKVKIGPEAKPTEAKAGNYKPKKLERVLERQIAVKDAKEKVSEKWHLYSYGPWGKLSKIKVEKNKTTELKFSGPIVIKVDTRIIKTPGNKSRATVSMGLKLVGHYGEEYSARVRKNGRYVEAPRLAVIDETEKEVATGKFEYG